MAVQEILEQLRDEEQRILSEAKTLQASVDENKRELKQIRAALAALNAKPSKAIAKPSRKAVTKADVIAAMESVLVEREVLDVDELKQAVEVGLSDSEKTMQGFALRFAESLKSERFVDTPGGIQLDDSEAIVLNA